MHEASSERARKCLGDLRQSGIESWHVHRGIFGDFWLQRRMESWSYKMACWPSVWQSDYPASLPRPHLGFYIFYTRCPGQGEVQGKTLQGCFQRKGHLWESLSLAQAVPPHTGKLKMQTEVKVACDSGLAALALLLRTTWILVFDGQWWVDEWIFPLSRISFLSLLYIQNNRRNHWNKHLLKTYFIPEIVNSHKNLPKKTQFPHLINEEAES